MFGLLRRKSRIRLLRENKAMRQALLWYAAQETWLRKGIHPKGAPRKQWKKSQAAFDRGGLAMRTLRKVDDPVLLLLNVNVSVPDPLWTLVPSEAAAAPIEPNSGADPESPDTTDKD